MFKKLAAVFAIGLCVATGSAVAADYPNQAVRVIVPFSPGGNIDVTSRLLSTRLAAELGQPFVVDNRAGAGGSIGALAVARAGTNGHTVLSGSNGMLAVNPAVNPTLAYDPIRSFVPVAFISRVPLALTVSSALPVQDLASLKAHAKATGHPVNIGSSGAGGAQHLAIVEFGEKSGVPYTHVPYKGGSAILPDLMAGTLDVALNELPNVMAAHRDGRVRIIALASERRSPLLPNVPTLAESGLPGFFAYSSNGWLMPAGTPDSMVRTINTALVRALADPAIRSQMEAMGLVIATPEEASPAAYGRRMAQELEDARRTAHRHGIRVTQ
ncbi:tripartite tricarboxylate transporter substrate binding protein [Hydrogenophaga sp.]|uniref:Bug family tripartite tricarboxylate transporter substrate binding protein n=1 Tax=Hydrogenophaga sp. TaxID=1904254 RepID=UPI002719EEAC|nr:tripartite tricarboxylate transporter substrate binding protein [Hydrogenophaga sp.]MDO9437916.1 tripartite tricarboxylate transporter substrate binding protein [Hydrogenophaga sp.]